MTFRRSKLMGTDWSGLELNPRLEFEGCDLRYVSFLGTNLSRVLFRDCKVVESNFIDCNLSGANFEGVDATKADFATAKGLFLNPAKNRVKGAIIPNESAVMLAMAHGMTVADL